MIRIQKRTLHEFGSRNKDYMNMDPETKIIWIRIQKQRLHEFGSRNKDYMNSDSETKIAPIRIQIRKGNFYFIYSMYIKVRHIFWKFQFVGNFISSARGFQNCFIALWRFKRRALTHWKQITNHFSKSLKNFTTGDPKLWKIKTVLKCPGRVL